MGFRFRRTIRVLPGLRLNLSRSGISTSVGVRGAHVTVGHGQVRVSAGIPGSGLSYTESERLGEHGAEPPQRPQGRRWLRVIAWSIVGAWAVSVAILFIASKV